MGKVVSYKNAPLVELIVQVQWPVQTLGVPGGPAIVTGQSAAFDIWFQRLTGVLREQGFHELERLVPHEMVVMAERPIYRYRRTDAPFPIIQFGHGIFTVNAGPPGYHSWKTFRPNVKQAIAALVKSKPDELQLDGFSRASLRYIDAFDERLRNGVSNFAFIRDDLRVSVELPEGLLELSPDLDRISPSLALRLPVKDDEGATLSFQLAAARLGNRPATDTIMDLTYTVDRTTALTPDAVLEVLQKAYEVIHGWFEQLTSTLRDRMEPSEEA